VTEDNAVRSGKALMSVFTQLPDGTFLQRIWVVTRESAEAWAASMPPPMSERLITPDAAQALREATADVSVPVMYREEWKP